MDQPLKEHKMYWDTKQLREHCFLNNNAKPHGRYLSYHPNGLLSQKTTFNNGKYHGKYISFHDNGCISRKCYYIYGNVHGEMIHSCTVHFESITLYEHGHIIVKH